MSRLLRAPWFGLIRSRRFAPQWPAALVAVLALGVTGCKSCDRPAEDGADGGLGAATSLTPEQARQVLARVGDETVTLGDYAAALEHMDQFDRLRYQSTERRRELLEEMITVKLLAGEATRRGWDQDPLAQQELRAILRDAMLTEARKDVPSPADVPEAEVRAWFEARRAEYRDPERRRVSVVVLRDAKAAAEVLEAAKKAEGAAQWGELVRARSIDPQARANVPVDLAGDLGIVSPPGDPRGASARVPEEVRAAVFEIPEVSQVLERVVVASGGGAPAGGAAGAARYYVVRLTQKLPAHERSFEEAERTIRVKLAQDKLRAKEDELIAELKKTVTVAIDESALATVKVDLGDSGAASPTKVDAGVAPEGR